ncbi:MULTISPECIES: bifunctional diguanylate cyclase/phosphodiesterase [unclassified Variovorax]|uniref:putative bifunctional diguanylate cyclase/phosphodiesterase n=1 Tax=unclassified Variovorax TaxID=663243 RepID=UPI002578669E|nr:MULTISPECIES: bifunctional diguanylate cyclase/phosphodiesterase [unclassified Variovorax]MDM0086470.1 bifunctional diguanylate cyclase/phosphodiesterase [Variovorax sp. J22G40]MDM0145273.1 bifunctional diguanylate cyclase/phosphodiesterase [Variovorax sp. J2P1-31]
MKPLRRFRTVLMAVVALVVAGIAVTVTLANYLMWSSQSTRFNITIESGQLSAELFRFELAVAERFLPGSQTTQAEVELRYQILLNRLEIIHNSETFAALTQLPEGAAEYAHATEAIRRVEQRLPELGEPAAAREVLGELLPLNGRILRLASSAQTVLTDNIARKQESLGRVIAGVSVIVVVLVLVGLALMGFVLRLKRRSDRDARHDALTGVLNRHGFNLALAGQPPGGACAIVLLDIDHFKDINDRFGHDAGDVFLIQFAARLAEVVDGAHLVARLGGDEFAIVFLGPQAGEEAEACCERIARALAAPFDVGEAHLTATASMGIAFKASGQLDNAVALMKSADIALYAAKGAGRARHLVFDPAMRDRALREQRLRQGLAEAEKRAEFHLRFQPIVDIDGGRTVGFEALLRWTHPELGHVSPADFIPVAERSGQIVSIGRWVVEEAFRDAATWPDDVFISINLSARQFTDATFCVFVERALLRFAIRPERVIFEITESVLLHNNAAGIISRFRRLGVQVALDDFGTGFASLSYLRRFELDKIKIDQSFMQAGHTDPRNAVIVRAICRLAEELDLEIIAEGVETAEHLAFVRSIGCRLVQGYYFSRPLLAEDCAARWQAAPAA